MSDDAYDILVKRSVIKENYADKTHTDLNNIYMIPCDQIDMFYNDSLFYLHFHYSLYTELLNFNFNNNFNIESFKTLWNKLKIIIDITETNGDGVLVTTPNGITTFTPNYTLSSVIVVNRGSGYAGTEKLIFTPSSGSVLDVGTVSFNSGLKETITPSSGTSIIGFVLGDTITFNAQSSGTAAVGEVSKIDSTGKIVEIRITTRGTNYTTVPVVSTYTLKNSAPITSTGSNAIGITFSISDITKYVNTVAVTDNSRIYSSIGTFSITAPPAGGKEATITPTTNIANIGLLSSGTFTFKRKIFKTFYNSILQYYNNDYQKLVNDKKPRIDKISDLTTIDTELIDSIRVGQTDTYTYTKNVLTSDYSLSGNTYFSIGNHANRKKKFNKTLKNILNQSATDILGYLAYQIRYYNIIVLNTSIQRIIYENYLRNSSLSMSTAYIFENSGSRVSTLNAIITHIDNMKTNLIKVEEDIKNTNNIYSDTTKKYPDKINLLNQNKQEYDKIQNSLNIVIKDYNQHYDNYNRLKNYASIIIIFIVILIIASIAITILPFFNANAKNTYYILMLILIIVLTILFYNNFSHINLYERFTTINCANFNSYKTNYSDGSINNINKKNNYDVFNKISEKITEYNRQSDAVSYQMSSGIYIQDEVLTADADNYINDIYLTKIKKINIYKTKHTELKNLIETMKQQIIYLYNIIIILCIFIIILLIALILYVNMPFATNYIIGLVSISIFILVIYYIYAIVKPTRLIANKNYWAEHNPSKTTVSKL